jgi:hypothetical protein
MRKKTQTENNKHTFHEVTRSQWLEMQKQTAKRGALTSIVVGVRLSIREDESAHTIGRECEGVPDIVKLNRILSVS